MNRHLRYSRCSVGDNHHLCCCSTATRLYIDEASDLISQADAVRPVSCSRHIVLPQLDHCIEFIRCRQGCQRQSRWFRYGHGCRWHGWRRYGYAWRELAIVECRNQSPRVNSKEDLLLDLVTHDRSSKNEDRASIGKVQDSVRDLVYPQYNQGIYLRVENPISELPFRWKRPICLSSSAPKPAKPWLRETDERDKKKEKKKTWACEFNYDSLRFELKLECFSSDEDLTKTLLIRDVAAPLVDRLADGVLQVRIGLYKTGNVSAR